MTAFARKIEGQIWLELSQSMSGQSEIMWALSNKNIEEFPTSY